MTNHTLRDKLISLDMDAIYYLFTKGANMKGILVVFVLVCLFFAYKVLTGDFHPMEKLVAGIAAFFGVSFLIKAII